MSESHTPGPWTVMDTNGAVFDLPHNLNSEIHRSFLVVAGASPVAKTIAVHMEYGLVSEANARLMAAAPDLLAACKLSASWQEWACGPNAVPAWFKHHRIKTDHIQPMDYIDEITRAAIAKAGGAA